MSGITTNDNEDLLKLRKVELKTLETQNGSITNSADHDSCCQRFLWRIRSIVLFESILSCVSTALTKSYDLTTILISIADVTTDIWVIYNFKIAQRNTFFIIALIVMILAQFSYAIAFMLRFHVSSSIEYDYAKRVQRRMILFFLILPLTPIISFIFYFCTEYPQNFFMKFLKKYFNVRDDYAVEVNPNQAKIIVWIEEKLNKHIGFILEALVEALPQSIIQLIAIVYYQDTELINVISICISLLSVSTKTMAFSVAIDFRVFIYNWLSLMCDFFGVFAIAAWVFYNPNNPGTITGLGEIWIYKASVIWVLSIVLIGIPLVGMWFNDAHNCGVWRFREYGWKELMYATPMVIVALIMWCIGSAFAIVICEIVFFAPFALVFWGIAHERYTNSSTSIVSKKTFDFILNNKSLYTDVDNVNYHTKKDKKEMVKKKGNEKEKKKGDGKEEKKWKHIKRKEIEDLLRIGDGENILDRNRLNRFGTVGRTLFSRKEQLFRLIYANYCFSCLFGYRKHIDMTKFVDYLNKEAETGWENVTLKDLRDNTPQKYNDLVWVEIREPFKAVPEELRKGINRAKNNQNNHPQWLVCILVAFWQMAILWGYFMLYIFFPLFLLSRLFSMLFPLMAIIYFNFDIESIQLLQWILTISYTILIISWIISAIRCFYYYHWTSHLIPGGGWWQAVKYNASKDEFIHQYNRLNLMQKYYDIRCNEKFLYNQRRDVVIQMLGRDIGGLIVSFWPQFEMKQWLDQVVEKAKLLDSLHNDRLFLG